ncbi:MAG TPA: hypothetical protein VJ418_27440 [Streptosporangiaceae bacterium]|nr:hypothetical protein [Streptosporangiaceae bacterium]
MTAASTTVPVRPEAAPETAERTRPLSGRRTVMLVAVYYLLAALALTLWLWRDPASRTVAGNPNDADQMAWFFRYDATAIAHFHLPALVTTAMNAPQGVNLMWNTPLLLPGVLLAPVTLMFGPQVSLTLLLTIGFAGSATAMFAVLRRWQVSVPGAALGAAVYGFSPALVHSAIGHYDLQFAVFPPLIVDAVLRLATGRSTARRGGLWLGLLVTAQLFISEEILFGAGLAAALLLVVMAASRPRDVPGRVRTLAGGLGIAAGVLAVLAGYPLWVQFFGPLYQHGSPFSTDFFKNDLSGFVVPSSYMFFHTAGSAAEALRYQGQLPEYLGYLGWPLIAVLAAGTIRFWRRLPVRACAVACVVLEVFSLGGTLLASGHEHAWLKLPWYWLQSLPVLSAALPDRFSIVADGAAAALLACCADAAVPALATFAARRLSRWSRLSRLSRLASGGRAAAVVMGAAVLAVLPIVPRPLPAVAAISVPPGWSAAFAALDLPASATVLAVPVPMSTFTEPLRWQADTGQPRTLVGGYFMGPAGNGHAETDGSGLSQAGRYLNILWTESGAGLPVALTGGVPDSARPGSPSYVRIGAVSKAKMLAQIAAWHVTAVVAVTVRNSVLGHYLTSLLGPPAVVTGDVMAWRT